jgi:hypothetical protein
VSDNIQWSSRVCEQIPHSTPSGFTIGLEQGVIFLSVDHEDSVACGNCNMGHHTKAQAISGILSR